ncbi:MAG TPA: DUF2807 domain-containing protein [Sediminibacterium sp.]|jgi:hypothetical protein|nr:DUF2807 domain-containing protein [Sediminibacterium sp.]
MRILVLATSLLALFIVACNKQSANCPATVQQSFDLTGFSKIYAGGSFIINITQANNFSITANGCAQDINDLDLSITNGNILHLAYKSYRQHRSTVTFTITLPVLAAINLSGNANSTITGFQGQNTVIRYILSGNGSCSSDGAGINEQIELSGNATLTLGGATENLYGNLSGNARLNGYNLAATEVDISSSGQAKAYVVPLQNLYADASGESIIYYKGNPVVTYFQTSGNGKIIQQ